MVFPVGAATDGRGVAVLVLLAGVATEGRGAVVLDETARILRLSALSGSANLLGIALREYEPVNITFVPIVKLSLICSNLQIPNFC